FPTLNALCSLPLVLSLDGQNIEPLLRDPEQQWDRPALTTHGQGNHAVRSRQWRYIRYADGGEELYDHSRDPNEWTNLASRPEFIDVKNNHAQWLPKIDAVPLRKKK
ncbi:MAG: iduronate-2-sulfatase, partial [Planctomycetaceae bacterium]|nr:iduronate-2-sulfatase [Planctomycetaceae bacterium]